MSRIDRRSFLARSSFLSALGYSASGWFPAFADNLSAKSEKRRSCILLWMNGGPSQTDTFDMKPGHANGGEFKEIETEAPGVRFSEHLPGLAKHAQSLAVVRGLSTKEGDHGRGTYLMRTGQRPMGPVQYPAIGASISKQLGKPTDSFPNYISIAPYQALSQEAFGPGFLGPRYAPLTVASYNRFRSGAQGDAGDYADLKVDDLYSPEHLTTDAVRARLELWNTLQDDFLARKGRPDGPVAQDTVYRRALQMMESAAAKAFDLSEEPEEVRSAYGRGQFGQGCLMARRLVEQGVAFVEVSLGSLGGGPTWDTHTANFPSVKTLSAELDKGWSTLMSELKQRGLLETTTILWMGEFGRTPQINGNAGRDHFPAAWTCVFAGGGIKGGQAFGDTGADGMSVKEGKVDVGDVLATLTSALGVEPGTENITPAGRPIKIAEGKP
ncbi:MAG: DUF1501 domain-containing protein, partial [Planctomycetaceae bacterium]